MENASNLEPRQPGRPRSERARRAILSAANELLERDGLDGLTVDAIAGRAGVSKATVYRWWPNKAAVAMDGFLAAKDPELRHPETGSVREDLRLQMRAVCALLAGQTGRTIAALVAEAQRDPGVREAYYSRFLAPRRAETRRVIERGMESGELRAGLDPKVAIDALYGPIYHRLLIGHAPLDDHFADSLAAQVFDGISAPRPVSRTERD